MGSKYEEFMSMSSEERLIEVKKQLSKTSENRIPLLVTGKPAIDVFKYLAAPDMTVTKFQMKIREQLELGKEQALFLFINPPEGKSAILAKQTSTIAEIARDYKHADGFVHLEYALENVFG